MPDENATTTLAETFTAALESLVPRMYEMGIRVVDLEEGHAVAAVCLEGNANHYGSMYAGALFGVAEVLGGALFVPSFDLAAYYPTVRELTISYQRPAFSDVRATAMLDTATIARMRTDLEQTGKASYELDAVLTAASGETVATTRGAYQIRTRS